MAETKAGDIRVFRGITSNGKPVQMAVFASGLNRPFGIAFYPPGPNPEWVYVGNMDSVARFPYQNGDLQARGPAQHIADLPGGGGHTTRDIQFSLDGKKMFVSVGSASNVDDPDTTPAEKNRADVLVFNPDGSDMQVYAYGIRNCVGLGVNPLTGELWCSTNERDGLGDNLVPDYITHVQEGGFYGWPWWYMGGHQDPRHKGKHPELKDKVITPDVMVNPHNASLGITFYDGKQFPAEYQGDLFASEHGSWNRGVRVGYELIRVPLHQTGHASGEYEDFMTGFVVDNGKCLGTPGWCHHGSRRLAAGHRRRFEFHLEDQLHRKVTVKRGSLELSESTMPDSLFSRRKLLKAAGAMAGSSLLSPVATLGPVYSVVIRRTLNLRRQPSGLHPYHRGQAYRTCSESHSLHNDIQRPVSRATAALERRSAGDHGHSQSNRQA